MTGAAASGYERRDVFAVRLAFFCALAAVVLAIVLLVHTSDYMFVVFMFVGPPLVGVAAVALGWVILRDLKAKKVF